MFLHILDNTVILAKYKINCTIDTDNAALVSALSVYQKEDFGLVVYSDGEKSAITTILDSYSVIYTVDDITYENEVLQKAKTKQYHSRSEAMEDIDIVPLTLDEYKQIKNDAFSVICTNEILGTFTSSAMGVEHIYSFDSEAQINLAGTKQAFADGLITSIDWNTRDAGVISHDETQFNQLWLDGFQFKFAKITKRRDKKDIVNACTTKDAVDLVEW